MAGYDPTGVATYNVKFRNPALSYLSGERILIIYSRKGLTGVQEQLDLLRARNVF